MRLFLLHLFFFLSITSLMAGDPDRLEVVVIADNNLCDNSLSANGAAYAVIIEDDGKEDDKLNDYTINWFLGTSTSGTLVHVGPTYDQMPEGTYTVQAIHEKSTFVDEVVITIANTSNGPDAYVDTIKDAKNCKENDGSAQVRVRADFPQEGPDHSHDNIKDCKHGICWTFVWYEGNNPFIGDIVAVGSDANNLPPSTYAVVVTNEANGCQTIVSLTVGLEATLPVVDGNVVANITDCNNLTAGSLTAFVNGENNNKFEFDWYIGDFIKAAPDFNNQATITGLVAGNYTVVATEKSSGCSSNPLTLTVEDLTSVPVLATNLDQEQVSCDSANPTGAVSATADGTTTGYAFEWFAGQNTLAGNLIGNTASLSGLAAGFYTVRATNTSDPNSQNCSSTAEIEVTESLITPSPLNSTIVDQTFCINPNGSIAVTVGGNTSDYTFYWFDGNIASPDINSPDFTGPSYSNLLAGDYTLIVENNVTSCATTAQAFTVADLIAEPIIALASSADLTSCAAPNGAISVTADGGTAGHTFRWFTGISTAAADEILPNPGASITGLTAGTYTVLVQNTTTGCTEVFDHTVVDVTSTPVPTTVVVDQSQCNPINGSITADVGGATAGFNFYWFDGNVATPDITAADFTGAAYTGLLAGDYTLVVEEDASKCTSAPEVITVVDATPTIIGTINLVTAQTSCDPAQPNGSLTASTSGGTSYTYEWFVGVDTSTPLVDGTDGTISGADGEVLTDLTAQDYTVLVTDLGSGCQDEVSYTLATDNQKPVITIDPAVDITGNSVCNPSLTNPVITNNGAIQSSVTYDGAAITLTDYRFDWYTGTDTSVPAVFTGTGADNYANISDGTYTLVVTRITAGPGFGCSSDPVTVVVPNERVLPVGTITLVTEQSSCDGTAPNGSISASALTGGAASAAGYTYEWFVGVDTSTPLVDGTDGTISGADGEVLTDLTAQDYTVLVTDLGSGCQDEVSYTLATDNQKPVITIDPAVDITGNSVCNPSLTNPVITNNGAIQSSVTYDGAAITLTDYRFDWYTGTDTSVPAVFTGTGADNYANISDGTYTLVVTRITAGPGFGCSSDPVTVVVPNERVLPVGTITLVTEQSSCDGTAPNGSISASALTGGAASAAGYTYEWFVGVDTSTPLVDGTDGTISGADGEVLTDLTAQDYTVLVTDLGSGCQDEVSYTLATDNQKPVITIDPAVDITGNSVCNPSLTNPVITNNGAIQSSVTYDGAAITLTDYRFDWYTGTDTSVPAVFTGTGADNYANISDGTYTLVVTRITAGPGFGCSSDPVTVVVPNERVLPVGTITLVTEQSSCDGTAPNGSISASALTGGAASAAGYTYEWFVGVDTSTPLVDGTDGTISGADGEVLTDLTAQDYTVLVTDLGSGCQDEVSYTLATDNQKPVITIDPAVDITGNSVCNPALTNPVITNNGAIQSSVTYDGAAITLTDYRFDWYTGTDTSVPAVFTGTGADNYANISDGTYTLVVTRITAGPGFGCSSDPVTVVVPNERVLPVGTITLVTEQSSCDGTAPNGSISASALTGGAASAAGYTYEWFVGVDTSTPLVDGTDGTISGADGEVLTDLTAQDYTVLVTDLGSGCQDEVSYTLATDNQKPVITIDPAVDITGNSVCNPALTNPVITNNGAIQSSVTYDGAAITLTDYRFDWYTGTDTSVPAVFTGTGADNYANISDGTYTLVVTRITAGPGFGCSSDPVTVVVPNERVLPVGTITLVTEQSSCDGTAPNGSISASALTGGAGSAAGYTYEWFVGVDTSTPLVDGTDGTISGADGEVLTDLTAQDYTVLVTDLGSGCQDEVSYRLPTLIIKPVIDIDLTTDITANTVCNPALTSPAAAYNGAIQANVTYDGAAVSLDDYQFDWYTGTDTSVPAVFSGVGDNGPLGADYYTSLAAGTYTLIVTRVTAGPGFQCSSASFSVDVPDLLENPAITLTKDALQTSCGAPNGQLTASALTGGAASPAGYSFEWFVGTTATTAFVNGTDGTISAAPGETISAIDAGNYTVRVTDLATGCQTVQDIYLDENIIDPVVSLAITSPMTDCTFDAVITPTITSANVAPSGHTYTWYAGQNTSGAVLTTTTDAAAANPELSTANTGVTIYAGYYTVVATDIFTGCASSSETIFLDRPAPLFDVLTNVNFQPSTCGVDEGIITAWVDLDADGNPSLAETNDALYTFEWYQGNPTDIAASYYTNPSPIFVPNATLLVDQTGMYPGSVPAGAGVNLVDYFAPENANAGASIYGIPSGRYTVVVTDDITGCKEFVGVDLPFLNGADVSVADVNITNSSNCSSPNGSLQVTALNNIPGGRTFADYIYNWYEGTNEILGSEIVDGTATVITTALLNQNGATMGLSAGYYTVVPIETFGSSCRLTPFTVYLDSIARQPVITETITNSTSCVGNGIISIVPSKDADDTTPVTTYSFAWSSGETTPSISNKLPGDYTVTVTDDGTTCSKTQTFTIQDQRVVPEITAIATVAQTFCAPVNGSLTIADADVSPGLVSDYSFTVYFEGTAAGDIIAPTTTVNATDVVFSGLTSGQYYITATRTTAGDGQGCTTAFTPQTVADDTDLVLATLSQTANTACDANPNSDATITVTMSTPSGDPGIAAANYDISFTTVPVGATVADVTDVVSPYTFTSAPGDLILPGVYTIEIRNRVSNCIVSRNITVEDNPEPIVFSKSDLTVVGQELCNPDGSITVNSISPVAVGNYTFSWYDGKANFDSNTPIAGVTGPVLDVVTYPSIDAGIYYVVATRNSGIGAGFTPGSGCSSVGVRVEIPVTQVTPVLSLAQTANTACDANPNSDATITVTMSTPSGDPGIAAANYDISFTTVPVGATVADVTDVVSPYTFTSAPGDLILPGVYTIEIRNRVSNCIVSRNITVEDNPEPIVFSKSDLTVVGQELCNPDGSITVNSISPVAVGNYTFSWYDGKANFDSNTPIAGVTGPVLDVVTYPSIDAGIYYVVATRNSGIGAGFTPGSGCSSVGVRVEIPVTQVTPVLSLAQTANTACDANPNSDATITVTMSTPSGDPGIAAANYDISFTTVPVGATVADVTDVVSPYTFTSAPGDLILPGVYTIEIRNRVSNCIVSRNITVEDNPEPIVFSKSDLTVVGQELCNPDGSITVNSISPVAVGNYTFSWYDGKANFDSNTPIAGVTGPVLDVVTYPSIDAGIYYVVATRNSGIGAGFTPGSGCSSVGVRVEIPVTQVTPVLSLAQTANTACDANPNSDATITVTMSTPSGDPGIAAANYDISFTTVPVGATVADVTDVVSPYTFTSAPGDLILPGVYTIEIRNRVSNCIVSRNITVEDNPEPIVFSKSDLTVVGQELCNPDGSITVNSISPVAVGNYTFSWYDGKANFDSNTPIAGVTGPVLDVVTYPSIDAGIYYVVATRNSGIGAGFTPGSGCSSVGVRVEIPVTQVTPVLSLAQTANTACDANPNSDATITVTMSTPSGDPGIAAANYDISFTTVPVGATVADVTDVVSPYTFTSAPGDLILPGVYTIEIRNRVSNCIVSRNITVEDNPEPIVFSKSDLTVVGQELCNPDGSITVNSISPVAVGNYTFSWYDGKANFDSNTPIAGVTGPVLDVVTYPSIDAGIYYVVATRNSGIGAGFTPGSGCSSVGVRVEIPVTQVTPVLSLAQTANTACDANPNSDATITVTMSTPSGDPGIAAANYDISFTTVPVGATVADVTDVVSPYTFTSAPGDLILPGVYTIEIRNRVSNCIVSRNITVEDNPEPIVFSKSDLTVVGQELCNPDGSITVNSISPVAVGNYTFSWYDGKANFDSNTPIAGVTGPVLDVVTYPSIDAGIYYVVATRNSGIGAGFTPGSGCSSVGVRVEIPVTQVTPVLSLAQTANTACDANPNSDATITVTMSTPSGDPGIAAANYDISFTTVPVGATVADVTGVASPYTFTSIPADLILPGLYEVQITNLSSNCTVTRSITVEDDPEPILLSLADIAVVDATNCNPDGSITVTNIGPLAVADYTYEWYDGEANYASDTPIAGATGNVLDNATYATIHPGIYYVKATRNTATNPGSSCASNAVKVEILDNSENPDVLIVENNPNFSCDPANPNGSLTASVPGFATSDYTFEWFIGLNNTTNAVAAANISGTEGETISGLAAGNYTLRVTDNTTPGQTCATIESFLLGEDLTINVPKNVSFNIIPQSDCFDSGSITVTALSPGVPADFSYEWYYESFDASGLIAGETSASLNGRPAGTYFVMITNIATSCRLGTVIEKVIPNTSTAPVISLFDAKPNTNCDPNAADGFLEALGDGQSLGYNFTWYASEMPLDGSETVLATTNRIDQLDSGYYSVIVQSTITNCSDTVQYYVEFLPELPKISLSTTPVTNCDSPNGGAYAQVYNLDGNFAFNWYIGTAVKSQPDYTGDWLRDVPAGDYVVEAIDLSAPACISEPIIFTIEEVIEVPQIKLEQISPNTYCDPNKVNGVAELEIYYVDEDDVTDTVYVSSNFMIDWIRTDAGAGTAEYTGRINSGLAATDYTITYTNIATACQWQSNITITEELLVVPPPEVAVIANLNSCEAPNGEAGVLNVANNPSYLYQWYQNIGDSAFYEGAEINTLAIGSYYVTALDTISGCESEATLVDIVDGRIPPVFQVTVQPELCGEGNGAAIISINADYEYRLIEWDTPFGFVYGESIDGLIAGDYTVTIVGSNGCSYTEAFVVEAEINIFNGISPNNDGVNDSWQIGCIENYQNNKVEIYNRAGALVFSTDYYSPNNEFRGEGNRGLYIGGKTLPDGTYFYVISKGDGSDGVSGYIELFR